MAPRINFITGNAHKLREVKAMLEPEIEVQNQNLDLEEVQGTIEEVSKSKCRRAAETVCRVPLSICLACCTHWPCLQPGLDH